MATKAMELKMASLSLSHREEVVVAESSEKTMVGRGESEEEEEGEERMETRRTTRSMQAETGAMMRMISSPMVERRVGGSSRVSAIVGA